MSPHRFDQTLWFFINLIVGYANYRPAQRLKRLLPFKVAHRHIIQTMHPAVDLDNQTQPVAGEVRKIRPHRMLTAELMSVDLSTTKNRPDTLLRASGRLAQRPRTVGSRVRHKKTVRTASDDGKPGTLTLSRKCDGCAAARSSPLPSGEGQAF